VANFTRFYLHLLHSGTRLFEIVSNFATSKWLPLPCTCDILMCISSLGCACIVLVMGIGYVVMKGSCFSGLSLRTLKLNLDFTSHDANRGTVIQCEQISPFFQ
jgi:hypothetical protein